MSFPYEKMAVIGLGYVGLPTAVVFASKGFSVIGVDVDTGKVEAVSSGRCYLREPGLDTLLRDAVSKGFLRAITDAVKAVRESDAVIIAVPTPVKDGVADFSYPKEAILRSYLIVALGAVEIRYGLLRRERSLQ